MFTKPKCQVIAIEEHYYDKELTGHFPAVERNADIVNRMYDLGEWRLKEMDEAGIDIQVLSHGAPSTQKLSGDIAVPLAQRVNDRMAAFCAANPKRFAAFSALPTSDPAASADELERTVKLGFKGAMIQGSPTTASSMTSGSGRSSSGRRRWMCRSICTPRSRTLR